MVLANRAYLAGVLIVAAAFMVAEPLYAQLPADDGQVWKTYDISPYVEQAGAGSQRHVVDWVLQEQFPNLGPIVEISAYVAPQVWIAKRQVSEGLS